MNITRLPVFIVVYLTALLHAGNTHAQTNTKINVIPFQYRESLIYVKVKINKRSGLNFLINTGSNTTVIDSKTASELNLPATSSDTVTGTAGREPVQMLQINNLQVGNIVLQHIRATKRNLNRANVNGYRTDGVLGMDILKRYAVNINFRSKRITFRSTPANAKRLLTIPFEMKDGMPLFETRFNDTFNSYLFYNSGVSLSQSIDVYVNVSPGQWDELKKINRNLAPVKYLVGSGVGGDIHLPVINITSVEFNGMMVKFPYIIVQPGEGYFEKENAVGFFGNNLLEKYNDVTIDFLSSRVVFNTIRKIN